MRYRQFIEDYFMIDAAKTGQLVPFQFNNVQTDFYENVLCKEYDIENKGLDVPVREHIVKARREGFSSLILGLFAYANQFTYHKPEWFIGFHRKNSLIDKIETHFQEVMELPNITQAMGAFGPIEKKQVITEETGEVYKSGKRKGQPKTKKRTIKVPVYVPNVAVIKAKNEVAKILDKEIKEMKAASKKRSS